MPFKYEVNGQIIEFDKEPTEADIDEVATQLGQPQQENSGFSQAEFPESTPEQNQQQTPLSVYERFKYSFGNQAGRRAYLQERFPDRKISETKSGKLAVDGVPIDPEGFSLSDLPGDIVDVSDEVLRIAGQFVGAAKGTLIAPGVGTVIGGAGGRATGQVGVEAIGRVFNMQKEELGQISKDIAVEGIVGGTGEALGLGMRAISKPTVKFLRNLSRVFTEKVGRPIEQTVLNFTGGMEQRNIAHLQIHGASKILTKENLSDNALLNIGKKIQTVATEARKTLGEAVETGKGLIRDMNKANINVEDIRYGFGTSLQKVGLLKNNFTPLKPQLGTKLDAGQKSLLNIWNVLKTKQNISPAQALQWRTELDRIIKFNQVGKISITDAENALAQGLRSGLKQKLVDVSDEFAKANQDFASFAEIQDMLKGKLDLQTVENFLKQVFKGPQVFEDALLKLDKYAGKDSFLPKLKDVVAARDFASTTFRGIKTGLISGLVGQIFGGAGGILPAATLGVTLSTPRVAGKAIAGRQLLNKLIGQGIEKTGQVGVGIAPNILSTLISRRLAISPSDKSNNDGSNK